MPGLQMIALDDCKIIADWTDAEPGQLVGIKNLVSGEFTACIRCAHPAQYGDHVPALLPLEGAGIGKVIQPIRGPAIDLAAHIDIAIAEINPETLGEESMLGDVVQIPRGDFYVVGQNLSGSLSWLCLKSSKVGIGLLVSAPSIHGTVKIGKLRLRERDKSVGLQKQILAALRN